MAGYYKYSKSNNAVNADRSGLMTATQLVSYCREKKFFKGLTTQIIKNFLTANEWHHTSCRYNETNYYSINELFKKRKTLREHVSKPKDKQPKKHFFKCWNLERDEVRKWEWSTTNRQGNNLFEVDFIISKLTGERENILKDKTTHKTKIRINQENLEAIDYILNRLKGIKS